MYHNYTYRDASEALPHLLEKLLSADEVGSRGGSRVREMTHVGITLTDPTKREILVPGRRVNLAAQIAETAWILAGRNDIDWLGHYLPRAADFSDDGHTWRGGYGPRLRAWPRRDGEGTSVIDQLAHVVELLRDDPTSRRAVISLYDPQIDTAAGKDIPCNDMLMFTSRLGRLDLHVVLRSNDAFWGWSGINAFEWSVLQEVVACLLGIDVGSLHFSTNSFHLYDRHWKRASEILADPNRNRSPHVNPSPRLDLETRTLDAFDQLLDDWFELEALIRNGELDTVGGEPVDDAVDAFPEPMLRSWLRVLQWWWSGDTTHLDPLFGTRLWMATQYSIQPPDRYVPADAEVEEIRTYQGVQRRTVVKPSDFMNSVVALHNEKDAAYGDSWKRRGEMLGILANVARKIDRLAGGKDTPDESQVDTAVDLLVYLAKYRAWLDDPDAGADAANRVLAQLEAERSALAPVHIPDALNRLFDLLESQVVGRESAAERVKTVESMLPYAYAWARLLWDRQQWKDGNERRFWKGYGS